VATSPRLGARSSDPDAPPPPTPSLPLPPAPPPSIDKQALLLSVAPKKPNWDLKRDIADKLERLERRTQRALVKIMRAELESAEGGGAEV